ncbi:BnaCnng20220D [Brassica napus]|uniref:BnaCnng20220D protein n=2 Tax=Brassica TaxID=3705 RepID=A0A078IJ96_BRANA|nr:BnaCnng20220D [Brassica napus]
MLLVYKCLIKRGGLVESDKPTDVRKGAMEAVDECGLRVTVGDVASRAGLKPKLRKRFKLLMGFSRDYRSKLATKSLRIQIEPFLDKAKGADLTRVSFGTALITFIILLCTCQDTRRLLVLLSLSEIYINNYTLK